MKYQLLPKYKRIQRYPEQLYVQIRYVYVLTTGHCCQTSQQCKSYIPKGQSISKANCQAEDSSKKRTNEFVFTSMQRVFVRFLEESSARKKTFRDYLTFSQANKGLRLFWLISWDFFWSCILWNSMVPQDQDVYSFRFEKHKITVCDFDGFVNLGILQ